MDFMQVNIVGHVIIPECIRDIEDHNYIVFCIFTT
jgi:hypothetical protein